MLKRGFSKKKLGTLLKGARCLKDIAVLGQFCAEQKSLLSAITHTQNALVEL